MQMVIRGNQQNGKSKKSGDYRIINEIEKRRRKKIHKDPENINNTKAIQREKMILCKEIRKKIKKSVHKSENNDKQIKVDNTLPIDIGYKLTKNIQQDGVKNAKSLSVEKERPKLSKNENRSLIMNSNTFLLNE